MRRSGLRAATSAFLVSEGREPEAGARSEACCITSATVIGFTGTETGFPIGVVSAIARCVSTSAAGVHIEPSRRDTVMRDWASRAVVVLRAEVRLAPGLVAAT